ncbi:ZINC FINGER PROTEIN ZAT1-RELATED [Salix viminalis]|uniref:ZINC FINGER PROTEIN ZAT1-RELATED n=1 Tax=Salix viminalis TaxID=40686 RepID=A0A9Q0T7E7_SALVM|nr:ZINC FINGER PROTEIN ZAT1-RELATED [Salix viminalis]
MERHKCKLCIRTFPNGRALGGHMKAHLAATRQQLGGLDRTESFSSSYSSSSGEEEVKEEQEIVKNGEMVEEKSLAYGLRENPKKSFRLADPEFSFAADTAGSVVVQDRESETESRNPTRRRSKRIRKSCGFGDNQKQDFDASKAADLKNPSWVESSSPAEPRTDDYEEQVGKDGEKSVEMLQEAEEIKVSKIRGKFRCEKCMKLFRSSKALSGHKRICSLNATEVRKFAGSADANDRIFECPYCSKVFGSGQALGGHKRSHLIGSATSTGGVAEASAKLETSLIDLNLPAPVEDDEFSVVSDA